MSVVLNLSPGAPSSTAPRRRAVLAAASVVLLAVTTAGCMPPEELTFFDRTNALRISQDVAPVADHDALTAKAEAWARHMADTGVLAHSQLSQDLEGLRWSALAENVGVSTPTSDTLLSIHSMFAASAGHRANLLSTQFDHMGVGVARGADGRVWVAEVFARL